MRRLTHGNVGRTGENTPSDAYNEDELYGYSNYSERFDAASGMVDKKGSGKGRRKGNGKGCGISPHDDAYKYTTTTTGRPVKNIIPHEDWELPSVGNARWIGTALLKVK